MENDSIIDYVDRFSNRRHDLEIEDRNYIIKELVNNLDYLTFTKNNIYELSTNNLVVAFNVEEDRLTGIYITHDNYYLVVREKDIVKSLQDQLIERALLTDLRIDLEG